jgi:hypothetical protein
MRRGVGEGKFGVLLEDALGGGNATRKERLLVVNAFEDGEDVLGVFAVLPIEVEEGGVKFGQQFGALGLRGRGRVSSSAGASPSGLAENGK